MSTPAFQIENIGHNRHEDHFVLSCATNGRYAGCIEYTVSSDGEDTRILESTLAGDLKTAALARIQQDWPNNDFVSKHMGRILAPRLFGHFDSQGTPASTKKADGIRLIPASAIDKSRLNALQERKANLDRLPLGEEDWLKVNDLNDAIREISEEVGGEEKFEWKRLLFSVPSDLSAADREARLADIALAAFEVREGVHNHLYPPHSSTPIARAVLGCANRAGIQLSDQELEGAVQSVHERFQQRRLEALVSEAVEGGEPEGDPTLESEKAGELFVTVCRLAESRATYLSESDRVRLAQIIAQAESTGESDAHVGDRPRMDG